MLAFTDDGSTKLTLQITQLDHRSIVLDTKKYVRERLDQIQRSMAASSTVVLALAALIGGAWCAAPPVTFTVEKGSGPEKLALVIEFHREGDSMSEVEVRGKGSNEWMPMKQSESEGGVWKIESTTPLTGPFNFRFVSKKGLRNVFDDVVPAEYKIGTTYTAQE